MKHTRRRGLWPGFRRRVVATAPALLAPALLVAAVFCGGCATHSGVLKDEPVRTFRLGDRDAPLYLINFDKDGRCESPLTFNKIVAEAAGGGYTDVILMSHGWNNDYPSARWLYDSFMGNFAALCGARRGELGRDFRPLFVGVIWPSTLLLTPEEAGPRAESAAAGAGASSPDDALEQGLRVRAARDLAGQLAGDDPNRADGLARTILADLSAGAAARPAAADELAGMLAPLLAQEELEPGPAGAAEALKAGAVSAQTEAALRAPAPAGTPGAPAGTHSAHPNHPVHSPGAATTESPASGPATRRVTLSAEDLALPDPRWIVRVASVYLMKDRAGIVGDRGVSQLVGALLAGPAGPRVHLVGHSFGAKVVLAAAAAVPSPRRPVDSILLLEPAMSGYSMAARSPAGGRPGRYRAVAADPARCRQPVYTTFSDKDVPLTELFQFFLRRSKDATELAAALDDAAARDAARGGGAEDAAALGPPPRGGDFGALGGFGPQPLPDTEGAAGEVSWVFLRSPGERYAAPPGCRVLGLRNKGMQISSHGDVSNAFTWWALFDQVAR